MFINTYFQDDFDAPTVTVDGEGVTGITLPANPGANADTATNIVVQVGSPASTNTVISQAEAAGVTEVTIRNRYKGVKISLKL